MILAVAAKVKTRSDIDHFGDALTIVSTQDAGDKRIHITQPPSRAHHQNIFNTKEETVL